ncbi:DUF6168 family protein [Algibacter sp.]|uniref:DUF6168 family protein n=1 Tax=Algibacter sp. TaxID=1872428 RepID=UPI003429E923
MRFGISFSFLFASSFFFHSTILEHFNINLRFELFHIYSFHFLFSFIICCLFLFFSNLEKWTTQLGFIYIFALITKLLFFSIIFKNFIFQNEIITKIDSLNLLIPLFLFLFLEVYFIVKILNDK